MLGSIYGVYTSRSPHEPDGVSTQAPQAPTRVLKPTRTMKTIIVSPASLFLFVKVNCRHSHSSCSGLTGSSGGTGGPLCHVSSINFFVCSDERLFGEGVVLVTT